MNTPFRKQPFIARISGPFQLLFIFMLTGLLLLSLARLTLGGWQHERVLAVIDWYTFLLQGLRADLIIIALWLVPPAILAPFWARKKYQRSWWIFTYSWSLLGLILLIFIELATPGFILQYDVRPNRLFLEYLKYPKEVFSTLWNGFRGFFVGGILLTLISGLFIARGLYRTKSSFHYWPDTQLWLTWPLVIFALFAAIRSTTDHRPANPALFAITSDPLVNSLIINSSYSVLYAAYSLKHEAHSSDVYGQLPRADIINTALDWPWLKSYEFGSHQYPTLHEQISTKPRVKPLNLVIILEESLGATFVESLGGLAVTPELEKLKDEGWWFENLYATGTRSVRGIEAVVSGFMPTPAQSVVKLSLAQQNFFTLAGLLSERGYHTQFIYGGEAHFDNMRGFFTGNGFSDVVDLEDMPAPTFVGSWGASDEDLFTTAHQQLTQLHQTRQPFFSLIFTSSNHAPFEFPDARIALFEQPKQTVNNAVKYADYALGNFMRSARASEYWQDTLFLIVADHDNRVYGHHLVPIEKFHIPALVVGADIQPQRIHPVASQIDLGPTLLSLMGITSVHPMPGRDFTQDMHSPGRAMMQFEDYYAVMEQERVTILKPDQTAVAAHYNAQSRTLSLDRQPPTPASVKRALANVLLPSLLYRERRYSNVDHPATINVTRVNR